MNQVYANVFERPVLVPKESVTSLGSVIFAFLAAGAFETVEEAQDALCPQYKIYQPKPVAEETYKRVYSMYRRIYFEFGTAETTFGDVLPSLLKMQTETQIER